MVPRPGGRGNGFRKGVVKKPDFYKMTSTELEIAFKRYPNLAIDFCEQRARDFARQSDKEMQQYWEQRARQIKESL